MTKIGSRKKLSYGTRTNRKCKQCGVDISKRWPNATFCKSCVHERYKAKQKRIHRGKKMKMYTISCGGARHQRRICGYAKISMASNIIGYGNEIKINIINRYSSNKLQGRNKKLFDELMEVINKYYDLEENNSKCSNRASHPRNKIKKGSYKKRQKSLSL